MNNIEETKKILGLDVSTSTIGVCLFDIDEKKLLELTHISPKVKTKDNLEKSKIKELFLKVDAFSEYIVKFRGMGIKHIVIEEPLVSSNNVYTVATLLRFNGMISKLCFDIFGILPDFISTYESRSIGFPELMGYRVDPKGKKAKNKTLFGGHPKDVDKKKIVWEHVAAIEPDVKWYYKSNGTIDKKSYDASDAYCCVRAYMVKTNIL